jgi:Na+/H+-dicarboxylate symporter/ABC-type amino acid transport substrate-binding protein
MSEQLPAKGHMGLANQVLISLVLGIVCGLFFGEMLSPIKIVGDIFIRLLQITVIPYVSLSLITAIGVLHFHEIKSLAIKGGCVLLFTWGLALSVLALIPIAFPAWPAASFFSANLVEETQSIDFFNLFIPSNPFFSYANAMVPAIVIFSILTGIALTGVQSKAKILDSLSALLEAMMGVTKIVAKLSPIGVFALISSAFGTIAIEDLARLQVYLVLYALVALCLSLIVLPCFVSIFTPFRYNEVIKALRTPLITAFATGSSLIVLPMLIEISKKMIDARMQSLEEEEANASVQALIPTFYPFPTPGNLLSIAFILFSGWYTGSDVAVSSYPTLLFAGLPSLFGSTTIAIPFMLDLMRLPQDMFQLFLSVDVITVRFGTLLSSMHYAAIGLIGTTAMLGNMRFRWSHLVRVIVICAVVIVPVLFSVRGFYNNFVVAPYTKDNLLMSLRLQRLPQPYKVYPEIPVDLYQQDGAPATLAQIVERGALLACYQPNEYPSAYFNNQEPPQLVGFDIEIAHRIAGYMKLPLEFLPVDSVSAAAGLLNNGSCDIYMRSLPITWGNSQLFGLTLPIYRSSIGLIVKDHRRGEFQKWDDLQGMGRSLRLGIENTPEGLELIQTYFPKAEIVLINSSQEQRQMLESGNETVDAIFDQAEEGSAWTILYPEYSLVVPQPTSFLPVAYAVAHRNEELMKAVNTILLIEQSNSRVDEIYRYWMLGEGSRIREIPRWSVLRDVLGLAIDNNKP